MNAPYQIENRVDWLQYFLPVRSVDVFAASTARFDGRYQQDSQQNGHECGDHVVEDGPAPDLARGLGREVRHPGHERCEDERQDDHLEHVEQQVPAELEVHASSVVLGERGVLFADDEADGDAEDHGEDEQDDEEVGAEAAEDLRLGAATPAAVSGRTVARVVVVHGVQVAVLGVHEILAHRHGCRSAERCQVKFVDLCFFAKLRR